MSHKIDINTTLSNEAIWSEGINRDYVATSVQYGFPIRSTVSQNQSRNMEEKNVLQKYEKMQVWAWTLMHFAGQKEHGSFRKYRGAYSIFKQDYPIKASVSFLKLCLKKDQSHPL